MLRILIIFIVILVTDNQLTSQVRYAPAWFGPNANPVPEFTDATIPSLTQVELSGNYYFGFGDFTKNAFFRIEVPLLQEKVSIKLWSTLLESYNLSDEIMIARNIETGKNKGRVNGDIYVQTRILLLSEKTKNPAIILNSTLKTASGTGFKERRYFDTPGYYFDIEIGKSYILNTKWLDEIKWVANLGFICWETTNSTQNDAPLYGAKLIIRKKQFKWENTIAGYWGWMHTHPSYGSDYGDAPLIFGTILNYKKNKITYFGKYQYGINDFPYHHFGAGFKVSLDKFTPRY